MYCLDVQRMTAVFVALSCTCIFFVNSRCLNNQTYLDKHTGRNECCSELCENAEYKRTVSQCRSKCPECLNNLTYLDKHTKRFECCSELCKHAEYKGTVSECKLKCPGYKSAPEKQNEAENLNPAASNGADAGSLNSGLSPVMVALVSALSLCVVVVVVLSMTSVIRSRRRHPGRQDPEGNIGDTNNNPLLRSPQPTIPYQSAQPGHLSNNPGPPINETGELPPPRQEEN